MNTTKKIVGVAALMATLSSALPAAADCAQWVRPFTGTSFNGHTFPGATYPFGAVQASPDTGWTGWQYCSGYRWDDTSALGFSQSHLNGTGCPDLGDFLLLPFVEGREDADWKGHYVRESQIAEAGYYSVTFTNFTVKAEMTVTEHAAFYRFTYQGEGRAALLLDTQHGIGWDAERRILESVIADDGARKVWGDQRRKGWVTRKVAFAMEFDRPFTAKRVLPKRQAGEKGDRIVYDFDLRKGEALLVKIALSGTGSEGAKRNLAASLPGWDFDAVRRRAYQAWDDLLSRATVAGDDDQKCNFYTSLYHLFIQPNNIADVDGRYIGADGVSRVAARGAYYSTLSCWDTFRAAHPFYTILTPEKVDALVSGMIEHAEAVGCLPVWALSGQENDCMIGSHSIPVVVDAYLKGFRGFDPEAALRAAKLTVTQEHPTLRYKERWDLLDTYGYYPFDLIKSESVSRTLECAYDDWCIAQLAKALGKTADSERFLKRSANWKNLFDSSIGFVRGKDSKGAWREPFSPFTLGHDATRANDFTEGNSWHYTWHVMQDPDGLIAALGGREKALAKLSSLFVQPEKTADSGFVADATGLIGQYAHGNEPSHHTIYFFTLMGRPDLTARYVREVFDKFYLNKPDGLCGNDDCGQMSAWYVFSAMGFYPFNPCGGDYVLGAPQLPKITLSLQNGKTFTVVARNLSAVNKYVQSVTFNGRPLKDFNLRHSDIMSGGELVFEMTANPK